MAESDFTIGDIESAIDSCLRRNSDVPVTAGTVIRQLGGRKSSQSPLLRIPDAE